MALDYGFPPVLPGLPLGRTEGGMAGARAKRIFGIPIDKLRLGLRGFAGGLAAGMGAENPQAGFAAGLAGSLGTIDSIAAARAKAERQMLQDELDRRQWQAEQDVRQGHLDVARQRLATGGADKTEDFGVVPYGVEGPLGPGQVMAPENLPRGGFEEFAKQLARNQAEKVVPTPRAGSQPPQFSARDRALINQYKLQNPGASDEQAVLAISEGKFGAKPSIIETEQQATDLMRRPLYIGSDGRQTTLANDPVTGRPNPPMMTKSRRFFGNPSESQFGGNPLEEFVR